MDSEKRSTSASEPFKATKIWNSLVKHLKISLEPRRRRWKLQIYENCFRGCDVVEELQSYVRSHPEIASDPSRVQVKSICQFLLENRVIECVASDGKRDAFEHGNRLYRFVDATQSRKYQVPEDTDLSKSCEKSDIKKRRRSFDRRSLHPKSSRRKSYGGDKILGSPVKSSIGIKESLIHRETEGRRKRRLSFGGAENVQDAVESNPWIETPRARKSKRRQSFGDFMRERKPKLLSQPLDEISTNSFRDIWFEVALAQLLKLIDAPFLDSVLLPLGMKDPLASSTVYDNSYSQLQTSLDNTDCRSASEQTGGRRGRDSIWQKAALECVSAQNQFPLPQHQEYGHQNIMNVTEVGISNFLAEFYGSLTDSLIPYSYVVLVDGILQLLKMNKKQIPVALQLLIVLMPRDRQEHLKRLLNFMEKSISCQARIPGEQRMRYVCKNFMNGILPHELRDKAMAEPLVSLMITEHEQLFTIPTDIRAEVKRHLLCIQRGYDEPTLSTSACQRLTLIEYEQQMQIATKESLIKLMNYIIDDLSLTLKMKEHKLRLFKKHHLETFRKQFPSGEI